VRIGLDLAKNKKMFSPGQIVFAALFVIAFTGVLFWMYRKDRAWHRKQYKGTRWVLVFFISFVIILLIMKYLLRD
jgi:membrane-anchored protein YejM (alkaline phosphatase superfamily)